MLKEKTSSKLQNEIVAIKLAGGDEIITRLIRDDKPGVIVVNRPLAMVMAEDPSNPTQTRVMFTPWMVAAEDGLIEIVQSHVVALVKARDDAAVQYEQAIA